MEILGVTLDYDYLDADSLETYERENQKVVDRIGDMGQYQGKSTPDAFRIQCRIVNDFFDGVFGPGTAEKLFHGKNNIRDHMEAFALVAQGAMEARAEFDAMADRYSPNRAERRQARRDGTRQEFHPVPAGTGGHGRKKRNG
mgnify:FL=1